LTIAEIAPIYYLPDAHLGSGANFGSAFGRPRVGETHCLTKEDVQR